MLDPETLAQLRDIVNRFRLEREGFKPHRSIVDLGNLANLNSDITVDLEASEALGAPMVVLRPKAPEPTILKVLTPQEVRVAILVAEGLTNKEIARGLSISFHTVKDHIHHILTKTGLPSRAAIAAELSKS